MDIAFASVVNATGEEKIEVLLSLTCYWPEYDQVSWVQTKKSKDARKLRVKLVAMVTEGDSTH